MTNENYNAVIEQASANTMEALKEKKEKDMKWQEDIAGQKVSLGVKNWVEDEKSGRLKGKDI